jgi:hypothetical protein
MRHPHLAGIRQRPRRKPPRNPAGSRGSKGRRRANAGGEWQRGGHLPAPSPADSCSVWEHENTRTRVGPPASQGGVSKKAPEGAGRRSRFSPRLPQARMENAPRNSAASTRPRFEFTISIAIATRRARSGACCSCPASNTSPVERLSRRDEQALIWPPLALKYWPAPPRLPANDWSP